MSRRQRGSMRMEDMGAPMQEMLQAMREVSGGNDLLDDVSVMDITTVMEKQSQGQDAREIWEALKPQLEKRRSRQMGGVVADRAKEIEAAKVREDEQARVIEDEMKRRKEEREQEMRRKEEQEEERRKVEDELRKKMLEEQERQRREDEDERRRNQEEEYRRLERERMVREEEERQKEEHRKRQEDARLEQERLAREEEERESKEQEHERRKAEEERVRLEEERRRNEEDKRRQHEEDERRKEEEMLRVRQFQEEEEERDRRLYEAERERRLREEQENEARRLQEQRRRQAEEEDRKRSEELERQRLEEEYRQHQAKQAERLAQEAAEQRLQEERRREAEDRRKREGEENRRIAQAPAVQIEPESTSPPWYIFNPETGLWEQVSPHAQAQLENARQTGHRAVRITHTLREPQPMAQSWAVDLEGMVVVSAQKQQRCALHRGAPIPGQPPSVLKAPDGTIVTWSSLNPLSQLLERFPDSLGRVLEVKLRTGNPSVEIVIMGELPFTVTFAEMKQVDPQGRYRHVQRNCVEPVWEHFASSHGAWVRYPTAVSRQLERDFAEGVVQDADVAGQPPVEMGHMRYRNHNTGGFAAVRRSLM